MVKLVTSCCGRPIEDCPGCPESMQLIPEKDYEMKKDDDPIFDKIEEGTVTVDDFNRLIAEATPEASRDRTRRRMRPLNTRQHLDDEGHQRTEGPTFADRVQPKRKPEGRAQMHGRGKVGHRASTRTQRRKAATESKQFMLSFDKAGYVNSLRDELTQRGITEAEYTLESLNGGYVLTVGPSFAFDEDLKNWLSHVGRAERMDKPRPDIFESQVPEKFREGVQFIKENVNRPLTDEILEHVQDKEALNRLAARMMTRPDVNRDWLDELVRRTNE